YEDRVRSGPVYWPGCARGPMNWATANPNLSRANPVQDLSPPPRDNGPVVAREPDRAEDRLVKARWPYVVALACALPFAAAFAGPPDPVPEARALMRAGKFAEAAPKFEAYLATNRFDGRAWANYASCLHNLKQFDRAISAEYKAIDCGFNPSGEMYN